MSQPMCRFCDVSKIWEDGVLYRDQDIVAQHRDKINIPGYTIIYPLRHVTNFAELTDIEMRKIFNIAKKVTQVLVDHGIPRVYHCSFGEAVNHFHLHIVPRHAEMAEIEEVLNSKGGVDGAKFFGVAQKKFRVASPEELMQNPQVAPLLQALKAACEW